MRNHPIHSDSPSVVGSSFQKQRCFFPKRRGLMASLAHDHCSNSPKCAVFSLLIAWTGFKSESLVPHLESTKDHHPCSSHSFRPGCSDNRMDNEMSSDPGTEWRLGLSGFRLGGGNMEGTGTSPSCSARS